MALEFEDLGFSPYCGAGGPPCRKRPSASLCAFGSCPPLSGDGALLLPKGFGIPRLNMLMARVGRGEGEV